MIDFASMQVGQTLPLSDKTEWEHPDNCQAFQAAQDYTVQSAGQVLFSVETVWKDTPAGQKIGGYTITRTR
jgi:hypothetical protein